jgi:hypothetical protein
MHFLSFFRSNHSSKPTKGEKNFMSRLSKLYRKAEPCETNSDSINPYELSVMEKAELEERVLDWIKRSSISPDASSSEGMATQKDSEIASVSVDFDGTSVNPLHFFREVGYDQRRYICKRRRGKSSAAISCTLACDDGYGIKRQSSFQDFEEGLKRLAMRNSN